VNLPGSQSDDDGGRIGESYLTMVDQPEEGGRCRRKKRKTVPREAFNGAAAGPIPLMSTSTANMSGFSASWDCREPPQRLAIRSVDPVDQLKARVARIQPDDARADVIEAPGPLKPRAGKGGIVGWS